MPDLAEHRHNEVVERLQRIAIALEAIHQLGERQLKAFASAETKLEAGLKFFISAWQQRRPPRKPKT